MAAGLSKCARRGAASFSDCLEAGHRLRLAGRFAEARRAYQRAFRNVAEPRERADALCGDAMALRGLCRYRESLGLFARALVAYRKAGDLEGAAFVLYGRGGAKRFLGRYPEALEDLDGALLIAPDAEARGGLFRMIGRHDESLADYTEARSIAGRLRLPYPMAYADCGIGNAWRMKGDARRARRHLRAADLRYRSIGDRVSRPYTLVALALMELAEGRGGRAPLREALRLFRSTRDARGLVYIDLVRAAAEAASGRTPTTFSRKALAGARKLGLALESAHARFIAEWPGRGRSPGLYQRLDAARPAHPLLIP